MRTYVRTKRELTEAMQVEQTLHSTVYRTRALCGCTHGDRRRDAVIAVRHGVVENVIIRCKNCEKGGCDGTL